MTKRDVFRVACAVALLAPGVSRSAAPKPAKFIHDEQFRNVDPGATATSRDGVRFDWSYRDSGSCAMTEIAKFGVRNFTSTLRVRNDNPDHVVRVSLLSFQTSGRKGGCKSNSFPVTLKLAPGEQEEVSRESPCCNFFTSDPDEPGSADIVANIEVREKVERKASPALSRTFSKTYTWRMKSADAPNDQKLHTGSSQVDLKNGTLTVLYRNHREYVASGGFISDPDYTYSFSTDVENIRSVEIDKQMFTGFSWFVRLVLNRPVQLDGRPAEAVRIVQVPGDYENRTEAEEVVRELTAALK